MKKIVYLFSKGRKKRLAQIMVKQSPSDFLYGAGYFIKKGYVVDILEQQAFHLKFSLRYALVFLINLFSTKLIGIGINAPPYLSRLHIINNYDFSVGGSDSISLALAYYKKMGWLRTKIVFLGMGLAARLKKIKQKRFFLFPFLKRYYGSLLNSCNIIVVVGQAESIFFATEFPVLEKRIYYIPFGIDTDFWTPDTSATLKRKFLLFVGTDFNRNYDLFLKITQAMRNFQFIGITSHIYKGPLSPNLRLIHSDWHKELISDLELRDYYRQSLAVILPLKESLQPSGQSVTLQAMACGVPVIITKTEGFWDPDSFVNFKHCIFVESNSIEEWSKHIHLLLSDHKLYSRLTKEGRKLVVEKYNAELFAQKLEEVLLTSEGRLL